MTTGSRLVTNIGENAILVADYKLGSPGLRASTHIIGSNSRPVFGQSDSFQRWLGTAAQNLGLNLMWNRWIIPSRALGNPNKSQFDARGAPQAIVGWFIARTMSTRRNARTKDSPRDDDASEGTRRQRHRKHLIQFPCDKSWGKYCHTNEVHRTLVRRLCIYWR